MDQSILLDSNLHYLEDPFTKVKKNKKRKLTIKQRSEIKTSKIKN